MSDSVSSPISLRKPIALGDVVAGLCFLAGMWYFAQEPLWHTDLWAHLSYGRYYSEAGRMPEIEPFLPLGVDRPFRSSSWLWQWGAYQLQDWGGNAALQMLAALSLVGSAWILFLLLRSRATGAFVALLAVALYVAIEWQQFLVVRPQFGAILVYPLLLWGFSNRPPRWWCVLVLLAWVNLHGSYVMGLFVPGLIVAGEGFDVWCRTGRLGRVLHSKRIRASLLLLVAMTLVTVGNPYGPTLLFEVLSFTDHPNLSTLIEWKPIYDTPKQGRILLGTVCLSVLLMVLSERRWRWKHWLPAIVVALLTLRSSRFIVWLGPLLAIAMAPYLMEQFRRCRNWDVTRWLGTRLSSPLPYGRTVLVLIAAGLFVATPLGATLLRNAPASPPDSYGYKTPRLAAEYLNAHPPDGLILNAMEWGDWLIWSSHGQLQPFVASHVTYLPDAVWEDYFAMVQVQPEWRAALDRYPFAAACLDLRKQADFIAELKKNRNWREVYRDNLAVIFVKTTERD